MELKRNIWVHCVHFSGFGLANRIIGVNIIFKLKRTGVVCGDDDAIADAAWETRSSLRD